jgi:hypothetical protein
LPCKLSYLSNLKFLGDLRMASSKDMDESGCSQFLGSKHDLAGEAEENHRKSDNNGLQANIWTRDLPKTTCVAWSTPDSRSSRYNQLTPPSWYKSHGNVLQKETTQGVESKCASCKLQRSKWGEEYEARVKSLTLRRIWSALKSNRGPAELRPSPLILSEARRCDSPRPQWPAAYHSLTVVLSYCLRPLYLYSQVYILLRPLTQYHTKL